MSNVIKSRNVIIKQDEATKFHNLQPYNLGNLDTSEDLLEEANQKKEEILRNAYIESRSVIEKANEEALSIKTKCIDDANAEIEYTKKKGYEEGYKAGKAEGFVDIQKEVMEKNEDYLAELCKQICLVEDSKEEILESYKKELSDVAIQIAEKIIRTEISHNDSIVKNIINNITKDYKNIEWLRISLSPNDYVTVSTDKKLMEKLLQASQSVKLEVATDNEDGDVIVETPDNLIDAGISTQLKNVKNMIS